MSTFQVLLGNMQQLGFFDFLFPFLLVLAISYGVLKYALKEVLPNSAIGLISIIAAFFVMNYSGSYGVAVANFFTGLFAGGLMIATGILVIIIIVGLFGIKLSELGKAKTPTALALVIIFVVFLMFIGLIPALPGVGPITLTQDFWTIMFFVVILAIVMWALSTGEKAEEGKV